MIHHHHHQVKLPAGYLWDKKISGKVVSPSQPRTLGGLYWGYTTRWAVDSRVPRHLDPLLEANPQP